MGPGKKATIQEVLQIKERFQKGTFSKKNFFSLLILAGACGAVFVLLSYFHNFEALELRTLDWRFRLFHAPVQKVPIVHVDIDQNALEQIGKWPFSRAVHAQVLSRLKQAGARQIAFDILFEEESQPEADQKFADEIRQAGNVLIAISLRVPKLEKGPEENFLRPEKAHWPLPKFGAAVAGLGFVDVVPDLDGGMRRAPLLAKTKEGKWIPHLALALALREWKSDFSQMELEPRQIVFIGKEGQRKEIPVDERGFLLINWAGKWQTAFPHISYAEILRREPIEDVVKGAICVVGFTAPGAVDAFPTPVGPLTPGVAGLAHATNTLLSGDWVTRWTASKNVAALCELMLFVFLGYALQFPWFGFAATVLAASLYPAIAVATFYFNSVWIDLALPMAAVLISSLVFGSFDYLSAYREKLFHLLKFLKLQAYTDHVVESMASGLVTVDTEGFVVKMNRNAERLLAASDAVLGKKCEEVDVLRPLAPVLKRAFESATGMAAEELEVPRDGKEPMLFAVRAARLKDAAGKTLGAVALVDDVTRERTLEAKVQQAKRLASLGELAAGVVHEVKNPLSAIRGFAELLANMMPDSPKVKEYKGYIVGEVDQLAAFVMDFLKFARPDKPNLSAVRINDVVRSTLPMCQPVFEKNNVRAELELNEALPPTLTDPNHLKQVLLNLVQNAAQAMEKGGAVRIQTRLEKATEEEKMLLQKQYDREVSGDEDLFVKIDVVDEGPGIPERSRDRLFEPFFSTKAGGTGLGLAISHKMIEVERGLLELVRDTQKGAHFKIVLPYRQCEIKTEVA